MEMPVIDMVEAIEMVEATPEAERQFSVFLADLLQDPEVIAGVQEWFEDVGVIAELVSDQASTIEKLARQVEALVARLTELERSVIRHRLQ
jgi:prophage DNA circulation protein